MCAFCTPTNPQLHTQWEGYVTSSSLEPQQGEHGQVTAHDGRETAPGKRTLPLPLSGPVSPRGIGLPSWAGNRYIFLNQGSCCHYEMLRPSKKTTYYMDETYPQSNDTIFFFLSTNRPESWLPQFPEPVLLFLFKRGKKNPEGIECKGACFLVPRLGDCSARLTPEIEKLTRRRVRLCFGPAGPPRPYMSD